MSALAHSVRGKEGGKGAKVGHPFLRARKDPTQRPTRKAGALAVLSVGVYMTEVLARCFW